MLFNAGGRRIHYDLVGPADGPVACMAHSLSSDSGVWSEQVPALLADGWRVLRLDMRGHGGSDPLPGAYTMAELAGDVVRVLDFHGLDQVHFIGVSIGGMIGQTLGIEHPGRILSLMLCGTSPKAVPGGMEMWDARFAAIAAAGSVEPLAGDTMVRWFTDGFRARRPDRWLQIRETVAGTTPDGYMGGAYAIIDFDVLDKLPSVRAPTLVVCGDDDPGTPAEGNRRIAGLIPGARYVEIPNARHIPMIEHPETFNCIMMEWLSART
jgi:3-oxoadipate enol-lactonase